MALFIPAKGAGGKRRSAGSAGARGRLHMETSAEQEVEILHGQGEVGVGPGGGAVETRPFRRALQAAEPDAERELGARPGLQLGQELPDAVRAPGGLLDGAEGGLEGEAAGGGFLEKLAVKLAAAGGPVGVDGAGPVLAQGAARLGQPRPGRGPLQAQPGPLQADGIVLGLQFDILEESAVAAKGAGLAQLAGQGFRVGQASGHGDLGGRLGKTAVEGGWWSRGGSNP